MMGHRVRPKEGEDHLLLEPSAYGKHPVSGDWMACTPNGHLGNLKGHEVTEHEDGTITVSPSILVLKPRTKNTPQQNLWHGYLVRGEWREC